MAVVQGKSDEGLKYDMQVKNRKRASPLKRMNVAWN